ncbi:MAG: GNAT family N-acetyltransferase [Crocinitomicaceae bacterium]
MSISFRRIEQKDDAALAKVIKTALEELNYAIEGTVYTDEATNRMSTCYQEEGSVYFIAEENGVLLGGSGIAPIPNQNEHYCELQRMFLASTARGKGIGKALMDTCINFAKESGYDLIYIETFEHMPQARKLYERSGFEYVDYSLGDTGHFSCDVKMILPLKTEKRK